MGTLGGIPVEAGDVLAKKYRVERLVGEGGTGVVLAATHLQLEQKVAIKVLRTALASDEIRLRFEREARAIEKIQSEHVVLVLDVGTLADGAPYMVMEYLEGRDLARVLKEDGPLPVEDAVDCVLQVCEALAEAHAVGIVHRDLKPANLFLTRRPDGGPHVKVVDFGISKILDRKLLGDVTSAREMTRAHTVLGSPRYMAPEQVRDSKDVDARADLWSVGAVLFQLVSGQHAFEADTNVQASVKVLSAEPQSLTEVAPHVPPELEGIVRRCLSKDRAARFQTAAELAEALRPFASDPTRDSLERLRLAREAPSVRIALPVGASEAPEAPPRIGYPQQPGLPPHPGVAPPAFAGAATRVAPPAFGGAATRPLAFKLAVAAGGFFVVLVAFVLLSAAKHVVESFGRGRPVERDAVPLDARTTPP